jgi:aminopeptidase N
MQNPAFQITNPNKVYSLIGAFSANLACFHERSGAGYAFLTDIIIQLDPLNALVAARMMSAFTRWKQFDEGRQLLMRAQLERLQAILKLSKDVFEVVTKCLA